MTTYRTVRFYQREDRRVLDTGLTLEEAQKHCTDPETASTSATSDEAAQETAEHGPWFDGWEEE